MARRLRGVCSSDSCVLPLANTFLCLLVKAVVHPSHDLLISPMPLHLSLHLCGDRKNTSLYMPLPLFVCLLVCHECLNNQHIHTQQPKLHQIEYEKILQLNCKNFENNQRKTCI